MGEDMTWFGGVWMYIFGSSGYYVGLLLRLFFVVGKKMGGMDGTVSSHGNDS